MTGKIEMLEKSLRSKERIIALLQIQISSLKRQRARLKDKEDGDAKARV